MVHKQLPVRSISLPSRLHPNSTNIEAELHKLKTWELSSASMTTLPVEADALQIGLVQLGELYNSVEEFIFSPHTQQALHQHKHGKLVEEALVESIGLLDVCGIARDVLLMMTDHVQDLESAVRRKGGVISSLESDIHGYICFRKKVKKDISKSLKALRAMENNLSFPLLDADHSLTMMVRVLREVCAVTISIFRSLLLFLSMPVMNTKAATGWSLISKILVPIRLVASERSQKIFNEVESVDFEVHALLGRIRRNDHAKVDVQLVQRRLKTLDIRIRGLEAGLDCMFRQLMQHRVSLLDIITHT